MSVLEIKEIEKGIQTSLYEHLFRLCTRQNKVQEHLIYSLFLCSMPSLEQRELYA